MKYLYYLLLIVVLTQCATLEKITSKNVIEKEFIEHIKDSTNVTEVNKKIEDVIITKVEPIEDHECDERLTEILNKLNTSKTSGDNKYRFYYDEQLRELRAEFEIGQTKNTDINTNEQNKKEYSVITEIEEYIKKMVIPWWMYLVIAYMLKGTIINIISIFIPGVRGIKSIADLFNPPNKV